MKQHESAVRVIMISEELRRRALGRSNVEIGRVTDEGRV